MKAALAAVLGAVAPLAVAPARAAGSPPPARSATERDVKFESRRVDLDSAKDRMVLEGDVAVTVDRYRLTSDRLSVEKTPRGVLVEGPGRVAFCPCPSPPVTIGFRSALAAPPTDLLLEQPTVRVYGVPVFWLPYLWLRSKTRFGLLPLELAYRGEDGPFAGSGVHVPVGDAALDVTAGGYFQGGTDVRARLATARTSTALRWDYLGESLFAADLRGSEPARGGPGGVSWSADVLRGARALTGPAELDAVALRQDRARIAAGTSTGALTFAVVGSADARRGSDLGTSASLGPGAHVGFGEAVGHLGVAAADVDVATVRSGGGDATALVFHRGELRADGWAGPVEVSAAGRSRAVAQMDPSGAGRSVVGGLEASIELPLVKEFGPRSAPLEHWIVPFASGFGGGADGTGPAVPRLVGSVDTADSGIRAGHAAQGAVYATVFGVRTAAGAVAGRRGALGLRVAAGAVGSRETGRQELLTASASGRAWIGAARAVAVTSPDVRSRVLLADARLGPEDGPFLSGHSEEVTGGMPALARLATGEGFDAPWAGFLDPDGWTAGARAGVPWTRFLNSVAAVDYDVTRRTWLGGRGALAFRHPCGCVAVSAWGGARLGRRGVDTWLTVDLMP